MVAKNGGGELSGFVWLMGFTAVVGVTSILGASTWRECVEFMRCVWPVLKELAQVAIAVAAVSGIWLSVRQQRTVKAQADHIRNQDNWMRNHHVATVRPVLAFDVESAVTVDGDVAFLEISNEGLGPLQILKQSAYVLDQSVFRDGAIRLDAVGSWIQGASPGCNFKIQPLTVSEGDWIGVGRSIRLLQISYMNGAHDLAEFSRFAEFVKNLIKETSLEFEYADVHGNRFWSHLNAVNRGLPRTKHGEFNDSLSTS